MKKLLFIFFLCSSSLVYSQSYIITTIAGNGTAGFSGDNGSAINAEISAPAGIAIDKAGNIYFADYNNNRIRKINSAGIITTYAGNGTAGYTGDGSAATAAELYNPLAICIDSLMNMYIADQGNNVIRKINSIGIISTFAGKGTVGFSGDGGPATAAEFEFSVGVAEDKAGNVYIADEYNNRIRKVDTNGIITTVAGNGYGSPGSGGFSGDGGAATAAELYNPECITIDEEQNIYFTDFSNNRIRKITPAGIINTVAGNGSIGFSGDNGPATNAELNAPEGINIDANGNLYIAENYNYRIRRVNANDSISTIAGNGTKGFGGDGGPATAAEFNTPDFVVSDNADNIYVSDADNYRIRELNILTGISDIESKSNGVEVYPTPNKGNFTIQFTQSVAQPTLLSIYNVMGQDVYEKKIDIGSSSYNEELSFLSNGVYVLKITSAESTFSAKLVVSR